MLPENHLKVLPEWIDHNGHMNVAYYVLAFDQVTDAVYNDWGIGMDYPDQGYSVFTLAMNVDYVRELIEGDEFFVVTQLLDHDHKRVHYLHQLHKKPDGWLAATNECLAVNVSLDTRRSTPFPESVQRVLRGVLEFHSRVQTPSVVSRQLGIRR